MKLNELKALCEKYRNDDSLSFESFAIRTQEVPFTLGEQTHLSMRWENGDETEEELEGLCGTILRADVVSIHASDAREINQSYYGPHCAIIGYNDGSIGEDIGEVIIRDPVVLEILS